tara:strand:- start:219 stop:443 length:225 start_codon:yes stop_codon:yes gene_type:complete
MRNKDKKQVITDFLNHMGEKDIHLVEIGKFSKDLSLWSKDKPQSSHRTLINVNVKLERLNEGDMGREIDKFLEN